MQPSSTRFANSIGNSHTYVTLAQIKPAMSRPGDPAVATLPISTGSVTADETSNTRRTCELTIPGTDFIPASSTDYLDPRSGYEVWLSRGIAWPDGTQELIPLGVFTPVQPTINDQAGAAIGVSIQGQDRSYLISRASWISPYSIAAGTDLNTAVQNALNSRQSGLVYNMAPDNGATSVAVTFGADLTNPTNPFTDISGLVTSNGEEVFFDPNGVLVARYLTKLSSPVVASYIEGPSNTLNAASKYIDGNQSYNGVIVVVTGSGVATPIKSILWFNGSQPAQPIPYFYTTNQNLTSAQAATLASQLRDRIQYGMEQVTLTITPDPRLQEGDVVYVERDITQLTGNHVIQSLTCPLDGSLMSITCRPQ